MTSNRTETRKAHWSAPPWMGRWSTLIVLGFWSGTLAVIGTTVGLRLTFAVGSPSAFAVALGLPFVCLVSYAKGYGAGAQAIKLQGMRRAADADRRRNEESAR